MPSPITPADFEDAVPANNANFCERFTKWLNVPGLLADLFGWMFTSTGAVSDEFNAEVATYSAPTGMLAYFATQNVGSGWLECTGQEVSRTTYADLFAAIGTRYGSGDGSTTFDLPDFRGRSLLGAGQGTGLTNRSINDISLGEERHTMTTSELVAHTHSWDGPEIRTEERGDGANVVWKGTVADTTESTGGGQPFNVIHPCGIAFIFIKT